MAYRKGALVSLPGNRLESVRRKLVAGLWLAGGVLLVVVALVGASFLFGSVATDEDADFTVRLAMLEVPVSSDKPILESPDHFLGVPHPEPNFDTSGLGPNLTFSQDIGNLEPLDPQDALRVAYLGHDQAGDPYYVYHVGSPNFRQVLGQILADFGSFGRLGSSYETLAVGDGIFSSAQEQHISERGLTNGFLSRGTGEPTTLVAEWHALPPDVSAVAFSRDGDPIGWQTPVSGTAALRLFPEDGGGLYPDVAMVAFTADGDEWSRFP